MYERLFQDIMAVPVPAELSPAARAVYPHELAKRVQPLLRHAVRYWELTLLMVERTGVQTEWAARTRAQLERVKAMLSAGEGEPRQPGESSESRPVAPAAP
jgi:hypothetical protein